MVGESTTLLPQGNEGSNHSARTAVVATNVTDAVNSDAGERHALADGIPTIPSDRSVSLEMQRVIAGVRTIFLCIVCGTALGVVYAIRGAVFKEQVWVNHVTLLAELCDPEAPGGAIIRGLDPEPMGFLDLIKEEQRKIITFDPRGPTAQEYHIPKMRYYASEEFKAGGPRWSIGYSLSMFPVSELRFIIALNSTDCLMEELSAKAALLGERSFFSKNRAVIDRFGLAITQTLDEAGRRMPHAWMATAPQFHGSMLIREDTQEVWESSSGIFGVKYKPSFGWQVYWLTTLALRIAGGIAVQMLLATWISKEWHRAVDTWIVQYDRLWAHRSFRTSGNRSPFRHRLQCCSSFFVLDHIAGDPQSNSENLVMGAVSAVVHGLSLVAMVVLPNVMALYFIEWKLPVWLLTGLHLLLSMWYGAAYYFNTRYKYRAPLLYMHLGCTLITSSFSLFYLISCTLFILTRPFVMPDEAMVYSVSIGTVVVYIAVVAHQMQKVRDGLIGQLGGKQSKGKVIGFLRYMGLDVKSIICAVFGGALLVLLVALLILLAGEMYLSSGPMSTLSTVFGTTATAFGTMFAQLRSKQAAQEESASGIPSAILDII